MIDIPCQFGLIAFMKFVDIMIATSMNDHPYYFADRRPIFLSPSTAHRIATSYYFIILQNSQSDHIIQRLKKRSILLPHLFILLGFS